jgi:hypothetical protein
MKNLGNQFNRRWPNRDGTSDGAIGDYAHSQEHSGHNADDTSYDNAEWDGDSDNTPEVRAIDVDNNLNDPEVSFQDVIDHMRRLPGLSSVIRYMIYNRKIYRAPDFEPVTYTGASAHTEHGHFSGAYSNASDANSTFDFKFEELGMPTAKEIAVATLAEFRNSYDNLSDSERNRLTTVIDTKLAPRFNNIKVPTAQENAAAVVAALSGTDITTLVTVLKKGLAADKISALKAAL